MDQLHLSSDSVLETLLKTNRPPTDQEKAIIFEAMAPSNAKLRVVEAQTSEVMAHIQALKLQVQRAEIKLQRLRKKKAAILETVKDHRIVLSAVRNLPEDVLREILLSCVEDKRPPILSYRPIPLPFMLAQISGGIRRIALSTPIIWASMDIQFDRFYDENLDEKAYSSLAHRARDWFERASGLPLTVSIECLSDSQSTNMEHGESDPSNILFNTLFSYSARWKDIQFSSSCTDLSMPVLRIAALMPVDVPALQSITLCLNCSIPISVLSNAVLFKTPALRRVSFKTDNLRQISVNWADLTAISLRGKLYSSDNSYSKNELARIFRETKCLVSCDITVGPPRSEEDINLQKIILPFLKTFHITERASRLRPAASPESPSLLDLLFAPILDEFHVHKEYFELSLLNFLERTQNISSLELPYAKDDKYLAITLAFLRHCPSLTALFLRPCHEDPTARASNWDGNMFLRSFVEVGGDAGVTCPCLQFFEVRGEINFSLETLRLFLEGKQKLPVTQTIGPKKIVPWRKVTIGIQGIESIETKADIVIYIFKKQSQGVNVAISML